MKKSLYLYLFIISALFALFTYVFYSKQLKFEKDRYAILKTKMADSLNVVRTDLFDAKYFTLESNDNAQNYLEKYSVDKLIPHVTARIMELNDSKEGNSLVDFEKMGTQKFIINKIRFLNHRWIIADYSNGQLWGEVLIQYAIEEDESVTLKTMQSFLYPVQK